MASGAQHMLAAHCQMDVVPRVTVRSLLVTLATQDHEMNGLKLALAVADELLQRQAGERPN